MENKSIITNFDNFTNESDDAVDVDINTESLETLVDLVGSEEEVEECAKEAFEELQKAFEKNEVELDEGETAESLAMAALIVKLVEKGKIGPEEADSFIEENI